MPLQGTSRSKWIRRILWDIELMAQLCRSGFGVEQLIQQVLFVLGPAFPSIEPVRLVLIVDRLPQYVRLAASDTKLCLQSVAGVYGEPAGRDGRLGSGRVGHGDADLAQAQCRRRRRRDPPAVQEVAWLRRVGQCHHQGIGVDQIPDQRAKRGVLDVMDGEPVVLVDDGAGPSRQQAGQAFGLCIAVPRRHADDAIADGTLCGEHARAWPLVPTRECAEEVGRARGC